MAELSSDEKIYKHIDKKNKIDTVVLDITWKVGDEGSIPTKIRFDRNIINYEQTLKVISDEKMAEFQFARCIWGNLQWESQEEIKQKMLEDIQKYFNSEIKGIHIFGKGHIHEQDSIIIIDKRNDKMLTWIKLLRENIDDEVWKQFNDSLGGKDSVIMK